MEGGRGAGAAARARGCRAGHLCGTLPSWYDETSEPSSDSRTSPPGTAPKHAQLCAPGTMRGPGPLREGPARAVPQQSTQRGGGAAAGSLACHEKVPEAEDVEPVAPAARAGRAPCGERSRESQSERRSASTPALHGLPRLACRQRPPPPPPPPRLTRQGSGFRVQGCGFRVATSR